MAEPAGSPLSWSYGPANSRLVRILFYLAEGILWGLVAVQVLTLVWLAVGTDPWLLGTLTVFLLLAVRWASFFATVSERSGRYAHRDFREWVTVRRWPLVFVSSVLFAGVLLAGALGYWWWFVPDVEIEWWWRYSSGDRAVFFAGLFVGITLLVLARSLSSSGEVDPETATLSYRERDAIDLASLSDVKRFTVGEWTVLWLRFEPGVRERTAVQGLYAIPTDVVERAWPAFEAGMDADPEVAERESTPRDRSLRTTNLGIVAGYVAFAVGTFSTFYLLGAPDGMLVMLAYVFGVLGLVFAWIAVRSI